MNKAETIILFSFLLQGVRCRDFSISLPEKIEALSGSCVIIKCTFEIENKYDTDLTESARGCWLKDEINKNQVFNSRDPNSRFNGKITGKLHEKNCTTIFYNVSSDHNGKYYFRIEGSGGLKWTYGGNTSTINVIESPPKPTVKLYEDKQEVLEGSSVSLRCSAETLCSSPPPTLTWSSTPRIPLSESSRQQELISDLNFTATHRHHRVTFTCTITYHLQGKNKTAQDNITLHVQYAPNISPSSSCNGSDVMVCFCEVDGNPSPELEWHLSGRPVTNSSNTSISEERLCSTGLRSSITLHQSLTHTSTLECVGSNTHGNARTLFQLNLFSQEASWFHDHSFLVGVVGGVTLMAILWVTTVLYKCICRTQRGDKPGLIRTDGADSVDNGEEPFYVNKVMMSSSEAPTLNHPETLHYSTINFRNTKPESTDIRDVSSLTEYAVVRYCGRNVADSEAKIREVSSVPHEDTIYQVPHKA